ncbi:glycosyltransferase family 48 protein [Tulasnella calospora MUT 4182]|uniref:1,3-beta-glucan synthase n=1 Tax=Tulasnella calospora MUT 4182 TaxID=1051891 RepID=A0A0C3KNF0_9AGAM|nr:glycosyltransferase family 48 protein [Tulasnella calospora MUT 4182]
MYSSTTQGRGSDSPNPFATNASPPNSFDSRDPFDTASSRLSSNHPNYYRDGEYSEMGDTIPREPTLESEANLVGRGRADSYATQGGGYDPYQAGHSRGGTDVESMGGGFYDRGTTPSAESLQDFHRRPDSQASLPTFDYASGSVGYEIYPAWVNARGCPISKEEIEDIFHDLAQKFGFQRDNMRNQFDFLMQALDSRASRMAAEQALTTLHADYIGGEHANYRKWYFAAQLDLDDAVGASQSQGLKRLKSMRGGGAAARAAPANANNDKSLAGAQARWRQVMQGMSHYDRLRQVALYLLCWGEAAQVRFVPECLCFIFKCADDYYRSPECQNRMDPAPEGMYLRAVVKPLYRFIRDQGYEVQDNKYVRRERDHEDIIGYDDVNQLFWYPEGIARIMLNDKTRLIDLAPAQRFMKFDQIDWNRAFFKTYIEKRTFLQLLVHFNRIWVIHVSIFWFYTAWNSPGLYAPSGSNGKASTAMRLSASALGGGVATIIMIAATLAEFMLIPTTWNNTSHLTRRLFFFLIIGGIVIAPTFYVAIYDSNKSNTPAIVASVQLGIAILATILFGVVPSGRMFGDRVAGKARKYLASQTFTASYPSMPWSARLASVMLWVLVLSCKLVESYFFLALSFKPSIKALTGMIIQGCRDQLFGNALCRHQANFALAIMFVMDLVLFFLDTFLWYVIWNTVFSICRSFALGMSMWTSWKLLFTRLPKRIYGKLLATEQITIKYKPKILVSQIWNAVIISMYREHLLSIDHVKKLLYQQVTTESGQRSLRAPLFFTSQDDRGLNGDFFPTHSEAERRISFFAQSLSMEMPQPLPVERMPTFSVLTPHYSEKILLSLREIIREEDKTTRVTLLEYLQQLHPLEWANFVKDTKILAEEAGAMDHSGSPSPSPFAGGSDEKGAVRTDDIPFYTIGFKSAAPEYTLRTRIWASLRAQTLYRTVSGFMNYAKAIKLLYRVENPELLMNFGGNAERLERELERLARRKFKFVVSMQRYSKFNKEEQENVEFLLRAYPDLQIAYLDEEPPRRPGGEPRLFSTVIDGHSEFNPDTGKRKPKFRIELPGNPILGDGKSDNQNHAIIFYRGEYLQLIDANQDNYLEECLKIRNLLGEFEEYNMSSQNPYAARGHKDFQKAPVAILGAREYIFSENIGVLGDVAAGKEQTFGTLLARSLAWIGGKLHYGHPDFLHGIFMNTRGGVSKAQKGLHLNEDIFAGMNAFGRGGRIKHSEYYQCGKGRDLGFGTILNFQTKIGTGMGEQMLSREYYYLGSQLPLDRFLTFYYGHPGFHINNILVILSVQVFMLTLLYLGSLTGELTLCRYDNQGGLIPGQQGCYNLYPVFQWIKRTILSILLVFLINFLPLFLQELTERGTGRAITRLGKHFLSLSPIFEIFSTQIYTHSILSNLTFGGARYIATGRGFATARLSFSILYSRFAGPSIYLGMRTLLMLIYISMAIWMPHLIYFWISIMALIVAPFLFNPHQFSFTDFVIDYREFLRWMSRGNSRSHGNSWIGYCRLSRTMITGHKKHRLGHPSEKLSSDAPRAGWRSVFIAEIVGPISMAIIVTVAYMFVGSFKDNTGHTPPNPLIRILVVAIGPIVLNAVLLLVQFVTSVTLGPALGSCCPRFGAWMAGGVHTIAVVGLVAFFEFLWFLERWNGRRAVLGIVSIVFIQRAVNKVIISTLLTRESRSDETNRVWWSGNWFGSGNTNVSSPIREFVVKIVELSLWSGDFILGHILLFALSIPVLVPFVDKIHSTSESYGRRS